MLTGFMLNDNETDLKMWEPLFEMQSPYNIFKLDDFDQLNYEFQNELCIDFGSSPLGQDLQFNNFEEYDHQDKPFKCSNELSSVIVESNDVDDLKSTNIVLPDDSECNDTNSNLAHKQKKRRQTKIAAPRRKRKDIVFKSLLRRCKKYFQNEFDHFWNYSKVKKRRAKNYFFENVWQYVDKTFGSSEADNLAFYFASFINSKDTKCRFVDYYFEQNNRKLTDEEGLTIDPQDEVQNIHDILYKFTHEKMYLFFKCKQLSSLFKHYVTQAQDYIPKGFQEQLSLMLRLSENDFSVEI